MSWGLNLSAAVLVAVCATWAYRVNYATQDAIGRLEALRAELAAEREALAVLNAEWAYLNRPDRLAALVAGPGAALRLAPLAPEQFGEAAMVAYPPEPEPPRSENGADEYGAGGAGAPAAADAPASAEEDTAGGTE